MTHRRVFWLSMHVPYACRHAGVCCASGWPIPVERPRVARLQMLRADGSWLVPAHGAPADVAGTLSVSPSGHCVFHDHDRCEIQRAFGPGALPSACQHFPREVLIDPRGVFVTLSHYCPTAADLLFAHEGPVEVVEGPAVVPSGEPEGLDARDVLPPLLVDGVLMDHAGYHAWEAHMVRVLTRDDGRSPEAAVALLKSHATALQHWRPGNVSLAEKVATLGREKGAKNDIGPDPFSSVIRRFLAARAFASWMAYQGNGLRAVVGSLELTLGTLRRHIDAVSTGEPAPLSREQLKQAIRDTDLLLVHQMPRDQLARAANRLA